MKRCAAFVAVVAGWAVAAGAQAVSVEGLGTVAAPGLPGAVAVWGERAEVVLTAPTGVRGPRLSVVAAAEGEAGRGGRVVALAHDGYLAGPAMGVGETRELLRRAVAWAGGARDGVRVAGLGLGGAAGGEVLRAMLPSGGTVVDLGREPWERLGEVDVLVVRGDGIPAAGEAAVRAFLERGGGLVVAVTGWGWQQVHANRDLGADLVVNRVMRSYGLAFSGATTGSDGDGRIEVAKAGDGGERGKAHGLKALRGLPRRVLGAEERAAVSGAGRVILLAATFALGESAFARLLEERLADLPGMPVPTPQAPLDETRPLERVAHVLELRRLERQGVGEVRAHASSAAFPGAVDAAAERITRTVRVDLSRPRWHTTGLYAAAGERLRVRVAGEVPAGLRVRIGAHTDDIEHLPSWQRPPRISRSFEVSGSGETEVASPFGGAVYVEVPGGGGGAGGEVAVTISGAVAAPVFVLGETTAEKWREVRSAPGPWAELVVPGRLVLTTRSDAVREVEDLTPVMEHWRAVMDAMADLAGIDHERAYPERIVPDVQISAGYMHAGYPIMTHLDVTRSMVDLEQLRSLKGGWGFYHELGHNHQKAEWTFEGTGEVTCNLFVHYVFEKVVGMSAEAASERALGPAMRRLIEAHLAEPDFRRWQREPFLALAMYAQLHTTFGWEPFRRVFAEYGDLPAAERPQSQSDRRDQWMVRMSRAVGRNLGPFFDGWGVPVTEGAKAEVGELPVWVPW